MSLTHFTKCIDFWQAIFKATLKLLYSWLIGYARVTKILSSLGPEKDVEGTIDDKGPVVVSMTTLLLQHYNL